MIAAVVFLTVPSGAMAVSIATDAVGAPTRIVADALEPVDLQLEKVPTKNVKEAAKAASVLEAAQVKAVPLGDEDCGTHADAGSTTATATAITLPAACTGLLGGSDEVDVYAADVAAGALLVVALQPDALSDFDLCVDQPDGTTYCSYNGLSVPELLTAGGPAGTYYITVFVYSGDGAYALAALTTPGGVTPPCGNPSVANDCRADATPVGAPSTTTGSTSGATLEPGEPQPCGNIGATVWFTITPAASGTITLDTFGSGYDTVLAVHDGGSLVDCNDDSSGTYQSFLSFSATAGHTYHIQLGGYSGDSGGYTLNIAGGGGGGACSPGPANDCFADAQAVASPSTTSGSTSGATTESGEPLPCGAMGATVWFALTGASGTITADTFGSSYDTVLAVYTGSSLGTLSPIDCNDDSSGSLQSYVSWSASSTTTYYIQLGGYGGDAGGYALNIGGSVPSCTNTSPPNDCFGNAQSVAPSSTTSGSTSGATTESGEPLPCGSMGATVWFTLTGASGTVTADTFGSSYDTVLAVYTGSSLGTLSPIDCNDDSGSTLQSLVSWSASSTTTYYIQLGGYGGDVGGYALTLTGGGSTTCSGSGPANDCFAGAQSVTSPSSTSGSTSGATTESGEPLPCGAMGATVWFALTGVSGTVTADTFGSSYDTVLAVYTGSSLGTLTPLGCSDDAGGTLQSQLSWSATSSATYYIQLGGYGGATGSYVLNLAGGSSSCSGSGPANDCFAGATPVVRPSSTTGSTSGATTESGEPLPCGAMGSTVWFSISGVSGTVTVDTFGSSYDTVLAVYTGSSLSTLSPVACNDDAAGTLQSQVSWSATSSTTYYIQLGGYGGDSGSYAMTVS